MSRAARARQHRPMLWSDMRQEPNEEARTARAMQRRMWWILAVAALAAYLLIRGG
jgi:hypothetical protein